MSRDRIRLAIISAAIIVCLSAGGYSVWRYGHAQKHAADVVPPAGSPAVLPLPGTIEVADTETKQEQGLGGRTPIPDDYGMLFVFAKDDRYGFWMKDMLESIDIVWIGSDGAIVGIDADVSPSTYPDVFRPSSPVRYVIETRAGYAQSHHWAEGKRFDLSAYAHGAAR